jgi:putative solute:sodium symporter small subunit
MSEKPLSEVNFLRPKKGYMVGEVLITLVILIGWGGAIFGSQLLQKLLETDHDGENLFTRFSFFNLPLNVWFTGQFLPLWFVILCIVYNLYIDRLTERHSRRRYPYEHE